MPPARSLKPMPSKESSTVSWPKAARSYRRVMLRPLYESLEPTHEARLQVVRMGQWLTAQGVLVVEAPSTPGLHEGPAGQLRGRIPLPTGRAVGTNPADLLKDGRLNIDDLMDLIPEGTRNTWRDVSDVKHGFKYEFTYEGTRYRIRVHSADP